MEYMIITLDKGESGLLSTLLKKWGIKTKILSKDELEDAGMLNAIKEAENSGEGKLENVMGHLQKVITRK